MKPQGRLGDSANCPKDTHGCKGCSHNVTGPAVSGSPDVFVNGKPAHRMGDATSHCGGSGKLIEGSSNVFVGDSSSSGSASSSIDASCGICSLKKGAVPPPTEKAPSANVGNGVHIGNNVYIGNGGGSKPEEDEKPVPKESPILKEQNKRIEEQKAKMAASAAGTTAAGVLASKASGKDDSEQIDKKTDISFVFIDEETGEPLYRVKTKILHPDNSTVSEIRSSKEGSIEFNNVDKGSYSIETADLDQFHKEDIKMWIGNTYGIAKFEKKDINFPESIEQPEHLNTKKKYLCNIKKYKIQKGDTFSAIAASHNLSFNELGYFNWETIDKEEILGRIENDIGDAKLINDGQDIQFNEPKKPGILFIPEPWKEEGLESDNSYAVYAKKVMHKSQTLKIGLFFDGTGNSDLDPNRYSNIINLNRLYDRRDSLQENIYILGVGVENINKSDDIVKVDISGTVGSASGYRAAERLEEAAFEIKEHVLRYSKTRNQPPEKIVCDIFGFSRGACLARHFVNLIYYKKINFKDYRTNKLLERDKIKVNFLGIFDSVGSFGLPGDNDDKFEFHVDNQKADHIYHLVSEDERRKNFDLQSIIPGGSGGKHTEYHEISKVKPFNRVLYDTGSMREEVWPGVHSDIGSGYNKKKFEQGCSNNFLSLVFLKKMHEMALEHDVPFKFLSIPAESTEIEIKLKETDSYYKNNPNLYKEHLKYNKTKDYLVYIREAYEFIKHQPKSSENVEHALALAKRTWEPRIRKAEIKLENQKGKLRQITSGSKLDKFLEKYNFIEKYKHISHNPFNKKKSPDHYETGTGFDPNIDKDNSELYREFFLNHMHREVSEIDKIEAKDHELGK